jgi:outer membrane lipoprotein carrier protein
LSAAPLSRRRLLLAAGCALAPRLAPAQPAPEPLRRFLAGTQAAQARFTQVVFDRAGRRVQEASGRMQFARPGRFRWEYEKPHPQLIVGDGEQVWIWDRDLNQVTVRRLDRALAGTPAALLAGDLDIEKAFRFAAAGTHDGYEWIEAVPRAPESGFESVRLGFAQAALGAMELRDALGQRTLIRFTEVERNPKLAPQLFRFVPPKGADVVRD